MDISPRATSPGIPLLHDALQRFGRQADQLSVEAMLALPYVLTALTGDEAVDDSARYTLAEWVVTQLRHEIARIDNTMKRRIAEAVLATCPEFHGKTVTSRRAYVREHDRGFTDELFKRHRHAVVQGLAYRLARAYELKIAPRIAISGRYLDEEASAPIAVRLGRELAQLPITLASGGSRVGAATAYAMANTLQNAGTYTPERINVFVRTESTRLADIYRPFGTVTHLETGRTEARYTMLGTAQLVILFGGGDFGDADGNGTAQEAAIADELGIPIIPLATTGGTARTYWRDHRPHAHRNLPEPLRKEYDNLNNPDYRIAIEAGIHLIQYKLGLTPRPTQPLSLA
ncbi:hypothetical protein ACW9HC_33640 [Nocardia gipuzkoensis]